MAKRSGKKKSTRPAKRRKLSTQAAQLETDETEVATVETEVAIVETEVETVEARVEQTSTAPYMPSAHPSVSAPQGLVAREEFDALMARVLKLERGAKTVKRKALLCGYASDWKDQCSHAYHCLDIYRKKRSFLEQHWSWVEQRTVTPTEHGCMPAKSFMPTFTKAPRDRRYQSTCPHCFTETSLTVAWERQLLWLETPDEELYKLVEYDEQSIKYHASHICLLPNGDNCYNRKHIKMEHYNINLSARKLHQHGEYCDCHLHGREKCIGPGQKYFEDLLDETDEAPSVTVEELLKKKPKPQHVEKVVDKPIYTGLPGFVPYNGKKCDRCLRDKHTCDHVKPTCGYCEQAGEHCRYSGIQPKVINERIARNYKIRTDAIRAEAREKAKAGLRVGESSTTLR